MTFTKALNESSTNIRGSNQRIDEAQIIRRLQQDEKEMNSVILSVRVFGFLLHWHGHECFTPVAIKAGGFCFGTIWLILRNVQDLHLRTSVRLTQMTVHHLAVIVSHVSRIKDPTSPPVATPPASYAPDPTLSPSGSSLQQAIVFWTTGLGFACSAIFVAIFVQQKMRGHRVVLQSHSQHWKKAKTQEPLDGDVEALFVATDTIYRLFQASLFILLLGHANFFLFPVAYTIFTPTVLFGLIYVALG